MIANQWWIQSSFLNGRDETNDFFGAALVAGDFDGDGRADLAIGTPYEDVENEVNRGKTNVLYGESRGLTSIGSQLWTQDSLSSSTTEPGDLFGKTLTSGDFNGDGYDDLAVGAVGEDLGTITDSGSVNALYGSFSGLRSTGNQFWTQTAFPSGGNEKYDRFGASLATGDFNGDGYDDLVIGTPGEDLGKVNNAGKVNVLRGSQNGLTQQKSQFWQQNKLKVSQNESGDGFGASLTTGDFNGDGYDDLAVGTPNEDIGSIKNSGAVNAIYGTRSGLRRRRNQFWTQTSFPSGGNEKNDRFGTALASGDFNGDGYDDLAIGTPDEDLKGKTNAGKVNILKGSATGLTHKRSKLWEQDKLRGSQNEAYDQFGAVIAVGDFNNDGYDDLAIGAPREDLGSIKDAGAVNVLYGTRSGLRKRHNQFWTQDSPGFSGIAEAYDRFGSSLAVKDFNGDGFADLAIGVSGEDIGSISNSGSVQILHGSASGLIV